MDSEYHTALHRLGRPTVGSGVMAGRWISHATVALHTPTQDRVIPQTDNRQISVIRNAGHLSTGGTLPPNRSPDGKLSVQEHRKVVSNLNAALSQLRSTRRSPNTATHHPQTRADITSNDAVVYANKVERTRSVDDVRKSGLSQEDIIELVRREQVKEPKRLTQRPSHNSAKTGRTKTGKTCVYASNEHIDVHPLQRPYSGVTRKTRTDVIQAHNSDTTLYLTNSLPQPQSNAEKRASTHVRKHQFRVKSAHAHGRQIREATAPLVVVTTSSQLASKALPSQDPPQTQEHSSTVSESPDSGNESVSPSSGDVHSKSADHLDTPNVSISNDTKSLDRGESDLDGQNCDPIDSVSDEPSHTSQSYEEAGENQCPSLGTEEISDEPAEDNSKESFNAELITDENTELLKPDETEVKVCNSENDVFIRKRTNSLSTNVSDVTLPTGGALLNRNDGLSPLHENHRRSIDEDRVYFMADTNNVLTYYVNQEQALSYAQKIARQPSAVPSNTPRRSLQRSRSAPSWQRTTPQPPSSPCPSARTSQWTFHSSRSSTPPRSQSSTVRGSRAASPSAPVVDRRMVNYARSHRPLGYVRVEGMPTGRVQSATITQSHSRAARSRNKWETSTPGYGTSRPPVNFQVYGISYTHIGRKK